MYPTFLLPRFWRNIRAGSKAECWEWQGARSSNGYGQVWAWRKLHYAHRLSYILAHGEISPGLHVCHRCDNPPCCNPNHLFLGTMKDNIQDALAKGRVMSPQLRAKLSAMHKGKTLTPEHRAKLSKRFKGIPLSAEHCAKLKAAWVIRRGGPSPSQTAAST